MIRFRLFGYPTVWQDGQQVTGFISEKAIALLVFLLVSQETHARDYLTGLLWGSSTDAKAKASLRSALYNLGQLLPGFLEVTRKTIAIDSAAAYQADIDQLRQHGNAKPYTDDFLAGFYIPDAPEFEVWLLSEREQFRQLAITIWQAASEEATHAAERHRAYDAILKLEPWRESIYQAQMRLLAEQGQYAAALNLYQRCIHTLDQELDIAPNAETERLADQIRLAQSLPRHNLPTQPSVFFGREASVDQIQRMIETQRLISLVGLGGSGKTRLAQAVGRQCATRFLHGVVFVNLQDVSSDDHDGIVTAIVQSMMRAGMLPSTRYPNEAYLLEQIQKREMLLILDNFEHLLQRADVIRRILSNAPGVHLLVTSRERLGHVQEQLIFIGGLEHKPAVSLFLSVAQRIQPNVRVEPAIEEICNLVQGLPLALELAASWVDVQTPSEIRDDLRRSLKILQDDSRFPNIRHQSMEAIFEQAWRHLSPSLQQLLIELTYFQSGFTAATARAVMQISPIDLRQLKNRALIQDVDHRFQIHPLLKQFVVGKGEPQMQSEFSSHFLTHFTRVGQSQEFEQVRALVPDYENFARAWQWAVDHDPERLSEPAGYLHLLFADRGVDEWSNRLVDDALKKIGDQFPQLRLRLKLEKVYYLYWQAKKPDDAQALLNVISSALPDWNGLQREYAYFNTLWGWIHNYHLHDLHQAKGFFQRAADIWAGLNNHNQLASRLLDLGNVAFGRQAFRVAAQQWEACAAAARQAKNDLAYACAEFSLGRLALAENQYDLGEQKLRLAKPYVQDHHGLHVAWHGLRAVLHVWREEFEQAEASFLNQLEVSKIYGRIDHTIEAYCNLGRLALLRGDQDRADLHFAQAEALAADTRLTHLRGQLETYKAQPQFTFGDL